MQKYIDIEAQNFLTEGEVKLRFGARVINRMDAILDDDLASVGVARITLSVTEMPATQEWQYLTEGPTSKAGGVWTNTWIINDKPLGECKSDFIALVNSDRNLMLENAALVLETPNGYRWKFDTSSLTVLRENLLMYSLNPVSESLPPVWRDEDNIDHPCTIELLTAIAARYQSYKQELYTASWAMKATIEDESTNTHSRLFSLRWSDYFTEENGIPALRCIGQEYPQPEQE